MRRLKCEKETIILTNEDDGFYASFISAVLVELLVMFQTDFTILF